VAHVVELAPTLPRNATVVINLSGRGDKDVVEVARLLGKKIG
jgi:tryptophan synthase beta chain